jgi:hypothetical protein
MPGLNPEACRMTELAHVPENDDFYVAFLAPMESRMLRAVWRIVRNPDLAEVGGSGGRICRIEFPD